MIAHLPRSIASTQTFLLNQEMLALLCRRWRPSGCTFCLRRRAWLPLTDGTRGCGRSELTPALRSTCVSCSRSGWTSYDGHNTKRLWAVIILCRASCLSRQYGLAELGGEDNFDKPSKVQRMMTCAEAPQLLPQSKPDDVKT